jgi:hypothetical protein
MGYILTNDLETHFKDSLGANDEIRIFKVIKLGHSLESEFVSFLERILEEVFCQQKCCFSLK